MGDCQAAPRVTPCTGWVAKRLYVDEQTDPPAPPVRPGVRQRTDATRCGGHPEARPTTLPLTQRTPHVKPHPPLHAAPDRCLAGSRRHAGPGRLRRALPGVRATTHGAGTGAGADLPQPAQRCWMEREQVPQRPAANVGGAIVGAVIGVVIGHQIGGGSGRDLATAGGVVAGAAIGSQVGRDRYGNPVSTQEVQRCSTVNSQSEPAYWDVTYRFRGITHRAQMLSPPGRSLTVNGNGEPRE